MLTKSKSKSDGLAALFAATYPCDRTRQRTRHSSSCRLTVQKSVLRVLLPEEVVRAMNICSGQPLRMRYSPDMILLARDSNGPYKLREPEFKYNDRTYSYPQIAVPIGPGRPIDVKISGRGPAVVNHEIMEGCLILYLSERVMLTSNTILHN